MPFISNTIFAESTKKSDITYTSSKYAIEKSVHTVSDKVLSLIYKSLFQDYNTPIYTNNRGYFTDTHLYIFKTGTDLTSFQWTDINLINEVATTKSVSVEKAIYVPNSDGMLNRILPIIGTSCIIFLDHYTGILYRINLEDATITKLTTIPNTTQYTSLKVDTIRFSDKTDKIYMSICSNSGSIPVIRYDMVSNTLTTLGTHNNQHFEYLLDVISDKYYVGMTTDSYKYWNGASNEYYGFRLVVYDISTDTEIDYYINKIHHYEICNIMKIYDLDAEVRCGLKPFPLKPIWLGWDTSLTKSNSAFSAYADYKIRSDKKFSISYLQSFNTDIMNNGDELFKTIIDDDESYIKANTGCTNVVQDSIYDRKYMIIPQFTNITDGMSVMNVMCDVSANITNSSNTNYPIRPDITSIHNQLLVVSLKEGS